MPTLDFWIVCGGTLLVAGRGYLLNDYFDRPSDAINRPGRPLVSGRISLPEAWTYYALMGLGLLLLSGQVPPLVWGSWWGAELCLLGYAYAGKRGGLWSNALVAALSAWSLGMVGVWAERGGAVVLGFGGFAFLAHLIREMVKDLEDMPGDKAMNSRSLGLRWGIPATLRLLRVLLALLAVGIVAGQWFWGNFQALAIAAILLAQTGYLIAYTTDYQRNSQWLKALMLLGLFWLFLLFD